MRQLLWAPLLFFIFPPSSLAAPSISITSNPSAITTLQQFNVDISISTLDASSSYYLKARIGPTESELSKAHTYNSLNSAPDDWLSDSDAWIKFPTMVADVDGNWNGSLVIRAGDGTPIGQNLLVIRTRKVDSSTNYDSPSAQVMVNPAPTSTPTITPTPIPPTNTPGPTDTPVPTNTPKPSSTPIPTKTPTPKPTLKPPTSTPIPKPTLVSVFGEESELAPQFSGSPTNIPSVLLPEEAVLGATTSDSPPLWPAFVFIGLGLGGLGVGGFLIWKQKRYTE